MELPTSRKAVRGAKIALDTLLATRDDQAFADFVPVCAAALRAINTMIDKETDSVGRSQAFTVWWGKLAADPRIDYLRKIRNDELKEGETSFAFQRLPQPLHAGSSFIHDVIDEPVSRMVIPGAPHVQAGRRRRLVRRSVSRASIPGVIARITKPKYGGNELGGFLTTYLAWMTDEILPTAEQKLDEP